MKSIITILALLLAAQAQAQTIVINPPPGQLRAPAKGQRVTVAITLSTPVSSSAPTEWSAELNDANQALYKVVGAECAVLNAVFKGECKLSQINTTGNINDRNNFGNPSADGSKTVNVTANATFELAPLPATPAH